MTPQTLAKIYAPTPLTTCTLYAGPLSAACAKYDINTRDRKDAFLGQLGIESALLTRMVENLNYKTPERLDEMFSAVHGVDDAAALIKAGPQAIANRVYAGRLGNGDEASGDGWRYRGAGGIQCTGKANHQAFGDAIGMPLSNVPAYLQTPEGAMMVSGWFWSARSLNPLADKWDIDAITRAVNGPAMAAAMERKTLSNKARGMLV